MQHNYSYICMCFNKRKIYVIKLEQIKNLKPGFITDILANVLFT